MSVTHAALVWSGYVFIQSREYCVLTSILSGLSTAGCTSMKLSGFCLVKAQRLIRSEHHRHCKP